MMTVLVILEENELDEKVTVTANAANEVGSQVNIRTGDVFTVEQLVEGMMISSGNDAAIALAEFNSGDVGSFVEKMNQKAEDLGMINTHYANPTGLDHPNNYSTANDIAILSKELLKYNLIRELASKSYDVIQAENTGYAYNLRATNILIDNYLNVKGLKTGKTPIAGECLTALADGPEGNEVLTIMIGSSDRFRESKILLDWVYRAYTW